MACASCAKKKANSYQDMKAIETPPFRATDIIVYDIESSESRKFVASDWNTKVVNILLFIPNIESLKESNFVAQDGIEYTYVTSRPVHQIKDYLDNNDIGMGASRIFSSYLLVSRAGLMYNGGTKKAVVYVMKDGDTAKQEYFYGSTFDYNTIRGFLDDYQNGNN